MQFSLLCGQMSRILNTYACPSVYPFVCLSACVSACLCGYLSVTLSICLSISRLSLSIEAYLRFSISQFPFVFFPFPFPSLLPSLFPFQNLKASKEEFEELKLDVAYMQTENDRLTAELEEASKGRKSDLETIENMIEKMSEVEQENVLFGISNSDLKAEIEAMKERVGSLTEECDAARDQIEYLKGPGDAASQQVPPPSSPLHSLLSSSLLSSTFSLFFLF